MNPKQLRAISFIGILVALVMCIWYLLKTYQDGDTKWYFLIMAMGILMLLSYQTMSGGKKKRKR